ncbi:MAG: hypothetical protein EBE86_001000 [Hormoscilla sp. GUM202]|nr:hypothetical protein [Hormoscilla sp. GM7CHS1pb]MBO1346054.1 hypothetical protein [Hormoscilla sp. GUM202]
MNVLNFVAEITIVSLRSETHRAISEERRRAEERFSVDVQIVKFVKHYDALVRTDIILLNWQHKIINGAVQWDVTIFDFLRAGQAGCW